MRSRLRSARRIAALGAACFIVATLVAPAQAKGPLLPIYDGSSVAQGAVATIAIRPSIFDPLAQAGNAYAESTLSSQADGAAHSIAAQIFPGKFGIGAVGCSGLKGWVQANYPAAGGCTADGTDTLYHTQPSTFGRDSGAPQLDTVLNTLLDRSTLTLGKMHAHALLGDAWATVDTSNYTVRSDPAARPSIEIGDLTVKTAATRSDVLAHEAIVTAKNISLMDGIVKIGSLVSRARATSNGTVGAADATITFGDVEILVNNSYHRATIDNHGIRVNDPALSRDQNFSLQEAVDEAFAKAGVKIFVSSPTKVVDGPTGEASISGLTFAITGEIPNVPIPSQLAPVIGAVINQLPTKCVNEFEPPNAPQVPLCFGPGVVPGPGSAVALSFTIGSAEAFTVGNLGYVFGGVPGPTPCLTCGTIGVPPGQTVVPTTQQQTPPVGGGTIQQPFQANGPRMGIFARLPSAALMWAGAILLVLAVGAALGPSLRHDAG